MTEVMGPRSVPLVPHELNEGSALPALLLRLVETFPHRGSETGREETSNKRTRLLYLLRSVASLRV